MNPQEDRKQGLDLPQPMSGIGPRPVNDNPILSNMSTNTPQPNSLLAYNNDSGINNISGDQRVQYTVPNAAPTESIDYENGVIDQEWVDRAMEIVERTNTDPYLQSREISKIKAQYIKARYSKEIKI